jgi:hypothetical protein
MAGLVYIIPRPTAGPGIVPAHGHRQESFEKWWSLENVKEMACLSPARAASLACSLMSMLLRPRLWRPRLCGAGVLPLLLVPVLAGCGSSSPKLDTVVVERAIANSILAERHIDATVGCPPDIPQQKGRVFTCTARLAVGAYPVSVTEIDGNGHVHYGNPAPLSVLDTAKVVHAITISIRSQRRLQAHVVCPSGVLQQKGLVFTCTATVHRRGYPFTVTEVDGNGHVQYVGH